VEIREELELTTAEDSLLDMHSVLNVLNIINYELYVLCEALGNPAPLEKVMHGVKGFAKKLRDRKAALNLVEAADSFIQNILSVLDEVSKGRSTAEIKQIEQSKGNLDLIFAVLNVRGKEIAARADNPHAWVIHDIGQLKKNFCQVFKAIEQNAGGSYHIVENIACYEEGDYFLTLQIDSVNGNTVFMPAVFQDVIRDLIANARKYTSPGGKIISGVYQNENELRFVVMDNGRGIPEAEIPKLIGFGFRGSNVKDRPTRGGGFGLTKAYYVTKKHHGRMWISNRKPTGTHVEIKIPLPKPQE
jgi:signal transduction histidine kinase